MLGLGKITSQMSQVRKFQQGICDQGKPKTTKPLVQVGRFGRRGGVGGGVISMWGLCTSVSRMSQLYCICTREM